MLDVVGRYKVLDRLSGVGACEVYRARDTQLGRTVALKILTRATFSNPARRTHLIEAARALTLLSHPNIAALYEVGEQDGDVYLATEFVPGDTLTALIGGRPLNARRAVDLAIQIADALADAHAEGRIHGDLTAFDIMVTPKGHAKIVDFGLSEWIRGRPSKEETPRAVPSEQRDIFSLGVLLHEMLTGRSPLERAMGRGDSASVSSLSRTVPPELDAVVMKALASDADQSYQTAVTCAADLRAIAAILDVRSDPQVAAAVAPAERVSQATWMLVVGLVGLLLGALGALVWWFGVSRA